MTGWERKGRGLGRVGAPVVMLAAVGAGGCTSLQGLLGSAGLSPPEVEFQDATLVQAPSQKTLAAYACPRALQGEGLAGQAGSLACRAAFGAAPAAAAMEFAFDLRFAVKNPNRVPLPLAALATAVSLFPQTNVQKLGDVCIALCPPEDAACRTRGQSLCDRGANTASATDLLVAQGLRWASGQGFAFELPPLAAEDNMNVVARFSLVPEQVLPALVSLAEQSRDELLQGQAPSFRIPYDLQGRVTADGGSLGPLSANFGPVTGDWQLPTTALVAP